MIHTHYVYGRQHKVSLGPKRHQSVCNNETSGYNWLSVVLYNYPPKGRWIVVDIYRDAKRRGIYPPLFTDPEGDSCFSIYQIRCIKKRFFNFFFWNVRERTRHFSLDSQNSEYPRIFRVTGASQNARKLLSTNLVNTNTGYFFRSAQLSNEYRQLFLLIYLMLGRN